MIVPREKLLYRGLKLDLLKSDQVSSIAVTHGSKLLMGKRRDNGRWTLPGGHADEGEKKEDCASRELKEEAGIECPAKKLTHMGSKKVTTYTGKKLTIHSFHHISHAPTTMKDDPDKEVERWHWVDVKNGLPDDVANNLHSPKNATLQFLGLQKADKIPGGLADKKKPKDFNPDALKHGIKIEMEHTSDPKIAKEIAMDHLMEDPNYYKKLEKIEKGGLPIGTIHTFKDGKQYRKESDNHWVPVGAREHSRRLMHPEKQSVASHEIEQHARINKIKKVLEEREEETKPEKKPKPKKITKKKPEKKPKPKKITKKKPEKKPKSSDGTHDSDFLPKDVKVGDQHVPADELDNEVGENHRLNNLKSSGGEIHYYVSGGKVVGHVGIDDEGSVKALYVDPEHRRKGIAEKMYLDIANKNGEITSDDANAMEPGAIGLWEKFKKKYPDRVTVGDDGKYTLKGKKVKKSFSLVVKGRAKPLGSISPSGQYKKVSSKKWAKVSHPIPTSYQAGFYLGKTKTGKRIDENTDFTRFTVQDHIDAAQLHRKKEKIMTENYRRLGGETLRKRRDFHHRSAIFHLNEARGHADVSALGKIKDLGKQIWGEVFQRSEFYITDLEKGDRPGPHKYLRKFRRGGKDVYIYYEKKGRPGRQLTETQINLIKKLAELGDEKAQRIMREVTEINPQKLKLVQELAELKDEKAQRYLKQLGIDWKQERAEREILGRDPIDSELTAEAKTRILRTVKEKVNREIFDYLRNYQSSPFARALTQNNITLESVMSPIERENNLRGILTKLQEQMKGIQEAQSGAGRSSNNRAASAGGYGKLGYREAILGLQATVIGANNRVLPEGYHKVASLDKPISGIKEIQERLEAKRRAEEERRRVAEEEARRAIGVLGPKISYMERYLGRTYSLEEKKKIARGMLKFFNARRGEDIKWDLERWVKQVQHGNGKIEVKITGFNPLDIFSGRDSSSTGFNYRFIEKSTGTQITSASRSFGKKEDGSMYVVNSVFSRPSNKYLKKYPGIATDAYEGTETMLREASKNLTGDAFKNTKISIGCANSGFTNGYKGAVVWANHRYDFSSISTRDSWRGTFKRYFERYQSRWGMSDEELAKMKRYVDSLQYPYQFTQIPMRLTSEQMPSKDWDVEHMLQTSGSFPVGSWIIIHAGITWGAVGYVNETEGRHGHLNRNRIQYRNKLRERYAQRGKYNQKHTTYAPDRDINQNQSGTEERNFDIAQVSKQEPRTAEFPESLRQGGRPPRPDPRQQELPTQPQRHRVTRPRNFRSWPSERMTKWILRNSDNMSYAQLRAARNIMRDRRRQEERGGALEGSRIIERSNLVEFVHTLFREKLRGEWYHMGDVRRFAESINTAMSEREIRQRFNEFFPTRRTQARSPSTKEEQKRTLRSALHQAHSLMERHNIPRNIENVSRIRRLLFENEQRNDENIVLYHGRIARIYHASKGS